MEKSLIINEPIEVEAEEVFKVKINGKDHYLTKEEYNKYKERAKYIQELYGNNTKVAILKKKKKLKKKKLKKKKL